jgi:hypothetical protein
VVTTKLFGLALPNLKESSWIVVIFFLALSLLQPSRSLLLVNLLAQAGSAADKSAPEYMDLRRYHLTSGPGVKLTNDFLPML